MGRSPCCVKEGLNKGAWTAMEDKTLVDYIKAHGEGRWRNLPKRAGLKRCGKSCRLRWLNYLRPDIKRGNITPDEEELIIRLHKLLGNRWSLIAGRLPGRTDNEIKNYWNTNLGKRVNQQKSQPNNCNTANTKISNNKHQKSTKMKPVSTNQSTTPIKPVEPDNVIRTKAVRCTKVFIDHDPSPNPQPQPQPQPSDEEYDISGPSSMDFTVDDFINMGEFNLIPELLNSEFSDFCDFTNESSPNNNNNNNNNGNDLSPDYSPEGPFLFSQELLDDWLGDHQNLSSLLAIN